MQAKNLKYIRNCLFLTQEVFGSYFQLTRHQINSYEIGRARVSPALIDRLCRIFSISYQDFEQTDLVANKTLTAGITKEALESAMESPDATQVNEWKEKYYTVLEKYNEALEQLRKQTKE